MSRLSWKAGIAVLAIAICFGVLPTPVMGLVASIVMFVAVFSLASQFGALASLYSAVWTGAAVMTFVRWSRETRPAASRIAASQVGTASGSVALDDWCGVFQYPGTTVGRGRPIARPRSSTR